MRGLASSGVHGARHVSTPTLQTVAAAVARPGILPHLGELAAEYASKHWTRHDFRTAQRLWDGLVGPALSGSGRRQGPFGSSRLPTSTATSAAQANGGLSPQLQEFLAGAYGNRFLLFMAADASSSAASKVLVLESAPLGCLGGTSLESSVDIVLPLEGAAGTMSVTPNGQYLFASLERSAWQLHSMERSVAVCAQLALKPADPYLQSFMSTCNPADSSPPPRLPRVSDFLQVRVVRANVADPLCPTA